jgi:hypothetical protein
MGYDEETGIRVSGIWGFGVGLRCWWTSEVSWGRRS